MSRARTTGVAAALAATALAVLWSAVAAAASAPSAAAKGPDALSNGILREAVTRLEAGKAAGRDVHMVGERVQVEVLSHLPSTQLRELIKQYGGVVQGTVEGQLALALVPYQSLDALEHAAGVRYVRPPLDVAESVGDAQGSSAFSLLRSGSGTAGAATIVGQEVAKTNASAWQALGYRGAGVKIGIIDGFSNYYWDPAQAAGEVPAPAGTFCLVNGSSCDIWSGGSTVSTLKHGVAVAETIHEMAPDAVLYIATVLTASDLQAAVNYFNAQGVKIISRSQTARYDGAGNGTGPVDAVVSDAVSKGMAWFNAAGNSAGGGGQLGSYWRGVWSDPDADGWLNFNGSDELLDFNCAFIDGLRWSDWGKADATDYDVYVYDGNGTLVSKSENTQPGSDPVEIPGCTSGEVDYLGIKLYGANGGTAGDVLEFMTNGAGIEYWQNPFSAAAPQVDSASPGMIAVGAIDPVNGTTIASYSSWGPTNDNRVKPDLSAAACFSSFSFSPNCFNGTSAATPTVAGAAALVLGAGLASTPAQLKTYLLNNATVDRGDIGLDNVYGKGELVLPAPPKLNQTITFNPLPGKTFGDADFALVATASSELAVSFAVTGNCSVSGATVHLTGAGSCRITASQSGSASYNAATPVAQTFSIARASQSITFPALPTRTFGDPDFNLSVTASSGLAVSFSAMGSCVVSGVSVHLTAPGSCTVTASQPGDSNFQAASPVSQSFSIKAVCRVPKVVGKPLGTARRKLVASHCRAGSISHAYSHKRKGVVISQSRRAGRVLPAGSRIGLAVSRGPRR